MRHQCRLLLFGLDRHKAHVWPRYGLASGRGVDRIVLAALDIGFDVSGWHQANVMTHRTQLTRPVMGRAARLHADQAWRDRSEVFVHADAAQLACRPRPGFALQPVDVKDVLAQINADSAKLLHGRSLPLWRSGDHALAL